jgi:hypothetical protein
MTLDELKTTAAEVARALSEAGDVVAPELRKRFIAVRAELLQRGVFDPVLVRFDSATVPRASVREIADHLRSIAENLSS